MCKRFGGEASILGRSSRLIFLLKLELSRPSDSTVHINHREELIELQNWNLILLAPFQPPPIFVTLFTDKGKHFIALDEMDANSRHLYRVYCWYSIEALNLCASLATAEIKSIIGILRSNKQYDKHI